MSLNKTASGAAKGAASDDDPAASSASKASNSLIVRMHQDSNDNLEALFASVLNPGDSKLPLQVPLRMRNLPNSFFTPPAAGSARSPSVSHSRANSADSAYDAGSQQNVSQAAVGATGGTQAAAVAATVAGGVAQSPGVPSSLTQAQQQAQAVAAAAVAAPPSRLAISHSRAHSSPASLQQTYSMHTNNANSATAGTSDGIGAAGGAPGFAGAGGAGGAGVGGFATGGGGTAGSAVIGGVDRLGQCVVGDPPNALQTFHMKQRSYDVVSPIQLQNELGALPPGWEQAKTNDGQIYYLNHATKTTQWEDPRIQYKQQQQQRLLQQALTQSVNLKAGNKESVDIIESLGPLPEGWEQAFTESGDIYFINHINRTTSWNDPRIPDFLQKSIKVPKPEMSWVNVRQLEKEHEFFKQKPEQNAMTRHSASLQIDPFLSGDNHARQESSDSGLSLSSNTFSVNAEFISQIDDSMDCISENGSINAMSGLDCPDNLVSSLQLEDNICNEMFNDVHSLLNSSSTKPDNLEWYKIN